MLSLPDVTILIMAPEDPGRAYKLEQYLRDRIDAKFVTYTDKPDQSWKETQVVQATDVCHLFDTEYVLHCECDGFPVNLDKWEPGFLEYDYIGAPWPKKLVQYGQNQVGNGGFSLSSRKFRQALYELRRFYPKYMPSDVWFAQYMYERLQKAGIRFADIATAFRFSFEQPIEDMQWNPNDSFGFHGKFNYFNDNFRRVYE